MAKPATPKKDRTGSSPVGKSVSQKLQDTFAVDLYPAPLIKWHPSVEQHESLVMDAEKRGLINKQPPQCKGKLFASSGLQSLENEAKAGAYPKHIEHNYKDWKPGTWPALSI